MMTKLYFAEEEQLLDSGVRRKWFDVPKDSLPHTFYLPLHGRLSVNLASITETRVKVPVARYERVPKGQYPDKTNGLNVYEYKGDEWR